MGSLADRETDAALRVVAGGPGSLAAGDPSSRTRVEAAAALRLPLGRNEKG
jgi:hypothetical protein